VLAEGFHWEAMQNRSSKAVIARVSEAVTGHTKKEGNDHRKSVASLGGRL
jgi:hypothetical protein